MQGTLHQVANDIELASVLSGNRNFEGRISPDLSLIHIWESEHVG